MPATVAKSVRTTTASLMSRHHLVADRATEHETAKAIASLARSPAANGVVVGSTVSHLSAPAMPLPASSQTSATLATSIGLGIQSTIIASSSSAANPSPLALGDATDAALKAVADALERGQISSVYRQLMQSGAFAAQKLYLHVKLGVPAAEPSYSLRTVDSRRVYEELLQPLGIPVAIPLQIVLGGLDAAHSLTVVAALSLHADPEPCAPRASAEPELRQPRSLPLSANRTLPAAANPSRADPSMTTSPKAASMHRTNSIDVLARISAEIHEEEESAEQDDDQSKGKGGTAGANYRKLPPGVTPKQNQRLFVKHQYRDHSREVPRKDELDMDLNRSTSPNRGIGSLQKRSAGTSFPVKLHETLRQIELDGLDNVVGWLPHGRSFKIFKQKEFVDVVLPKYFVMTKKSSFLRQLNLYGFTRFCGLGPDQGSYYHEHFLRGMTFLSQRMSRQKVNGNGIRSAGDPDNEPNLSFYPTCPPTAANERMAADTTSPPTLLMEEHVEKSTRTLSTKRDASVPKPSTSAKATTANRVTDNFSGRPTAPANIVRDVAPDNPMNRMIAAAAMIDTSIRGAQVSFPLKLQRILDKLEADGGVADIVSWQPHGRAFLVKNASRFVREVMPKYFSMSKFSSFQRQLHMYSFNRITASGRDKGAYWHPCFVRGAPEMAKKMQRTRIRGTGTRKPGNPNLEPDFYGMPAAPAIANGTHIDIPIDGGVGLDGPKPLRKRKAGSDSVALKNGGSKARATDESEDENGSSDDTEAEATEEEDE